MAEGKTLVPSAPCDLCDGDDSVNFCANCQQDLCLRCSTAHRKIPDLSHHKLRPITHRRVPGKTPQSTQAYCKDHPSKPLSVICEECLKALCGTCADAEHRNHKLLRTNLNPELLHRICVQKVPEFLNLLQKLDKEKDGSPLKLQLYKQARDMVKSWRDQLWGLIDDDSKALLGQIEKEIKNQEVLLADISSSLKNAVSSTEEQMSVLSNARKISNPDTLLMNIQDGDTIIKKAKQILEDIESTRESYTIDELLPSRNKLRNVEKNLHEFFIMTKLGYEKRCIGSATMSMRFDHIAGTRKRNYNTMGKIGSVYIGQCSGVQFRVSESSVRNSKNIVVYTISSHDIYVVKIESKQSKGIKFAKKIMRMASMSDDKHVVVETVVRDIHLLDGNFKIVNTLRYDRSDKGKPYGIHPVAPDRFILLSHDTHARGTVFLEIEVTKINTFNKRILCHVDIVNDFGLLSLHSDFKHITIRSAASILHTIDLTTGRYSVLHLGAHIPNCIKCVYVDEDDKYLVGDTDGKVHLTTSKKYECEFKNMEGSKEIVGISTIGDKVVTVCGEHINIYQ